MAIFRETKRVILICRYAVWHRKGIFLFERVLNSNTLEFGWRAFLRETSSYKKQSHFIIWVIWLNWWHHLRGVRQTILHGRPPSAAIYPCWVAIHSGHFFAILFYVPPSVTKSCATCLFFLHCSSAAQSSTLPAYVCAILYFLLTSPSYVCSWFLHHHCIVGKLLCRSVRGNRRPHSTSKTLVRTSSSRLVCLADAFSVRTSLSKDTSQ